MGKQRNSKDAPAALTEMERLGLRVSSMIGSPKAQMERRALIHRLDTDSDEAWDGIMGLLAETDGLALDFDGDGNVAVSWEAGEGEEVARVEEPVEEEALF